MHLENYLKHLSIFYSMNNQKKIAICITAGEQSENHVGMNIHGDGLSKKGFSLKDIRNFKKTLDDLNIYYEYYRLDKMVSIDDLNRASLLIIRNGIKQILDESPDNMLDEQLGFEWDTKYWDSKSNKVLNKRARYNVCYGNLNQEPDYENKKGRIVSYDELPILNKWRNKLGDIFGSKSSNLEMEGNFYYDITKCGINFHGDSERKKVIACSLGESRPIHWQWYFQGKPIGERLKFDINHGDIYIMSEKTTGNDWKNWNDKTLRHAAGIKYTK